MEDNKNNQGKNTNLIIIVMSIVIVFLCIGLIMVLIFSKKEKNNELDGNMADVTVTTGEKIDTLESSEFTEETKTDVATAEEEEETKISEDREEDTSVEDKDEFESRFFELTYYLPSAYNTDSVKCEDYGDSVAYYQTASKEDYGGFLFAISVYKDITFADLPLYQIIGRTADYYYVMEFPTDVQFNTDDKSIADEYAQLSIDGVDKINASLVNAIYMGDEYNKNGQYICPESSSRYMAMEDIDYLSKADLSLARNEIFARHGYIFKDTDINVYFSNRPWYNGSIEGASFDDSCLNDYEVSNIALIQQCEKDKGYK